MTPLTAQQEKLWRYLKTCERCPSFQEMADHMGLHSKSGIYRLVNGLEAKGYVNRVGRGCYRMARSLVVYDGPQPAKPPLSCFTVDELSAELDRRYGRGANGLLAA